MSMAASTDYPLELSSEMFFNEIAAIGEQQSEYSALQQKQGNYGEKKKILSTVLEGIKSGVGGVRNVDDLLFRRTANKFWHEITVILQNRTANSWIEENVIREFNGMRDKYTVFSKNRRAVNHSDEWLNDTEVLCILSELFPSHEIEEIYPITAYSPLRIPTQVVPHIAVSPSPSTGSCGVAASNTSILNERVPPIAVSPLKPSESCGVTASNTSILNDRLNSDSKFSADVQPLQPSVPTWQTNEAKRNSDPGSSWNGDFSFTTPKAEFQPPVWQPKEGIEAGALESRGTKRKSNFDSDDFAPVFQEVEPLNISAPTWQTSKPTVAKPFKVRRPNNQCEVSALVQASVIQPLSISAPIWQTNTCREVGAPNITMNVDDSAPGEGSTILCLPSPTAWVVKRPNLSRKKPTGVSERKGQDSDHRLQLLMTGKELVRASSNNLFLTDGSKTKNVHYPDFSGYLENEVREPLPLLKLDAVANCSRAVKGKRTVREKRAKKVLVMGDSQEVSNSCSGYTLTPISSSSFLVDVPVTEKITGKHLVFVVEGVLDAIKSMHLDPRELGNDDQELWVNLQWQICSQTGKSYTALQIYESFVDAYDKLEEMKICVQREGGSERSEYTGRLVEKLQQIKMLRDVCVTHGSNGKKTSRMKASIREGVPREAVLNTIQSNRMSTPRYNHPVETFAHHQQQCKETYVHSFQNSNNVSANNKQHSKERSIQDSQHSEKLSTNSHHLYSGMSAHDPQYSAKNSTVHTENQQQNTTQSAVLEKEYILKMQTSMMEKFNKLVGLLSNDLSNKKSQDTTERFKSEAIEIIKSFSHDLFGHVEKAQNFGSWMTNTMFEQLEERIKRSLIEHMDKKFQELRELIIQLPTKDNNMKADNGTKAVQADLITVDHFGDVVEATSPESVNNVQILPGKST